MKQVLPLIVMALALLVGCKATKKAYEKGDYETAVLNSIERLRSSPNNKKSRETLELAYPALIDYMEEKVLDAQNSADPFKWESIVSVYEFLNRVNREITRSPAALKVVPNPKNYQSQQTTAERNAAEARYISGNQLLNDARDGDKQAAKQAYNHFERALEYRKNYKDTRDLSKIARELATTYVKVEPIPMHSRSLSITSEFFENQMLEFFQTRNRSPFVTFYSGKENWQPELGPDHIIRMIFDDFVVGQAYVKETVRERRKDSIVISEVRINDSTVQDVYGTVEAEVHQFRKEISSQGLLDYRIIDARTGAVITQKKFPGTFIWVDKWGFFNGDKRALNDEDNEFCRKRKELPNPNPQALFIEFTKPIYDQVTRFTRNFYTES
ncbi:MAG: hypothetical protein MRZ79_08940 [Bacteroidia bacterium]|nr:hypothetical protein [Bacteroidia bacterium]